jgi:hypothetical protein
MASIECRPIAHHPQWRALTSPVQKLAVSGKVFHAAQSSFVTRPYAHNFTRNLQRGTLNHSFLRSYRHVPVRMRTPICPRDASIVRTTCRGT